MRAEKTIELLKADAETIRDFGATSLHLYGSAARDELRADSDVDMFLDYDRHVDGTFSLIELIRLENHLKQLLQRDVDLTTRDGLHPLLRADIERSSVQVF
jgi:uncharacterized protein